MEPIGWDRSPRVLRRVAPLQHPIALGVAFLVWLALASYLVAREIRVMIAVEKALR